MGLALRRPLFYLLGLAMLGLAMAVGLMVPYGGIAAIAAVVSGVACAGAAARSAQLAGRGGRSPWGAWFDPWSRAHWARHAALVAAGVGALHLMGYASNLVGAATYSATDPLAGMASWPARLGWLAVCYALLGWLVAIAAPVRGLAQSLRGFGRVLAAPFALAGLGVFWFVFLGLSDALITYALVAAMSGEAGSESMALRVGLSTVVVFATLLVSAPAVAMSAGLASLDLDPRPLDPPPGGAGLESGAREASGDSKPGAG